MTGPHPALARCRTAVRAALRELPDGALVLVACSGGSDSLALAAATAFEAPRRGVRAGAIIIDHRLQADSDAVATRAAAQCRNLGLVPTEVVAVDVLAHGGPEAAARAARYAALEAACVTHDAALLLLGHTSDDQAEQVLLGLMRGSGTRSLAGIPPRGHLPSARFVRPTGQLSRTKRALGPMIVRPFLEAVGRQDTRQACTVLGLDWWEDPQNQDPTFARVRTRTLLDQLEETLGPGVRPGLVRTAGLARTDADHLDAQAAAEAGALGADPWSVEAIAALPTAIRTRVWRLLMKQAGGTHADVGAVHVHALDALITRWHGQGPIDIPGGVTVRRTGSMLQVSRRPVQ